MPNLTFQGSQAPTPQAPSDAPAIARVFTSRTAPATSDYVVLKAREKELKSQLQDVQDRRNDLAQQAEQSDGPDQASLHARVGVLDQRLSQIETDLATVGRQ